MNEDYKMGIRFLLKKCKEKGINIRKVEWVPNFSRFLSERFLCYRFWYNVYIQNRLDRIEKCETLDDIAFNPKTYLFTWCKTSDGISWHTKLFCADHEGENWSERFTGSKKLISF